MAAACVVVWTFGVALRRQTVQAEVGWRGWGAVRVVGRVR